MHLELLRDKAVTFPAIVAPDSYTSARVWHCKYRSLAALGQFANLRELVVASWPDPGFEALVPLVNLERLEVVHLPAVTSLAPLALLQRLRRLSLSTLPSWDASRKKSVVESLAPLAELPHLEELELFGVIPQSKKADDLLRSGSLKVVKVSMFPAAEVERVRAQFSA